ncbi:hypothetical protein PN499_12665 [Kamptonema animale CS-326]|jgi:ABC-type transporter Mla subunit MlaD|uniref:hypothetical protein n=1 Tax=Kamptonema animale TaxID=92934 RepID=UPI0023315998|nr:hypothetical protein [Kamptonema animale]MDB9512039.1 hypothetical protein [Kamptonema animale CS-326]
MSTERWDDERLDRLASLIENAARVAENAARVAESNSRAIENHEQILERHEQSLERHDRLIESNSRVIQALANVVAEAREERQQLFQFMAQQQTEIRGMQAENRRILDILLNERDRGDNPSN